MAAADNPDSGISLLPPRGTAARHVALLFLYLAPIAFGLLAVFLGQDASWDLRNYHWYNAYAFLNGRYDTDFMPSQAQFFLNPLIDVPFYLLAQQLTPRALAFLLGAVQGLNVPLLFMLAHATLRIPGALHKTAACALLASLGVLSAMGISEIGTVFYDNVTSLGILLSALLLIWRFEALLALPPARAAAMALLFGLPAGLMAGLKMTCAIFCAGECFALIVASNVSRRGFLLAFFFGLGLLLGFLVAYGAWGGHLWTHFGSPTFPYFNKFFRSPLLPPVAFGDFMQPPGFQKLLHPFRFALNPYIVNEISWQDWRIPILYVLVIAAAATALWRGPPAGAEAIAARLPARFLLWMAAGAYAVWISVAAVYRYLLPLDMLAPLLIVVCAGLLPLKKEHRLLLAAALLATVALTIEPGNWGRRAGWTPRIADITRPAVPDDQEIMILMAGDDAYAYMIPEFPAQVRFLRIHGRTFRPDQPYGLIALLRDKVEAHKGPLMLLMPARDLDTGRASLAQMGLAAVLKSCRTVTDNLAEAHLDRPGEMNDAYPREYRLCDVTRMKGKTR
jgi:hypothetical protein